MNGRRDVNTFNMSVIRSRISAILLAALLLFVAQMPATAQPSKGRNALQLVQDRHQKRYREFCNEISKLEDEFQRDDQIEVAREIHQRLMTPESLSTRVDKLPSEVQPEFPADVSEEERQWRKQLRKIEKDYAKDIYVMARGALKQGQHSYAYDLVREVTLHDPDHPQARRILGYIRLDKEWLTKAAYALVKNQYVWVEEFGWLPKDHRQKYLDGERFIKEHADGERSFKGRWVNKDKEEELRRDFKSAWEIRTDHYLIKTNVSLEKGVKLGKALEEFYEVFQETFAGFFHTPEQLQKLFDDHARPGLTDLKPYTVHFYRTREEYIERLRVYFPTIEQTNGVYMTSDRIAHFYDDPENEHLGTLYHEGTHQLFFESSPGNRQICTNEHFWVIEGIACYMESLHRKNGSITLGDPKYIRFTGARHNLIRESYYVPLREFSGMGMQDFQTAPNLSKNYTQAAGLARFFMQYDNGRYREALVRHLDHLYSSDPRKRAQATGLDELTGVEFETLDRQYSEDARQTDSQISAR